MDYPPQARQRRGAPRNQDATTEHDQDDGHDRLEEEQVAGVAGEPELASSAGRRSAVGTTGDDGLVSCFTTSVLPRVGIKQLAIAALAVRLLLILFSVYVLDAVAGHGDVQYTDVDYFVFTDAARHVAAGSSPFLRHTYRYTPLIAYLCLPNVWLWMPFGKVLFSCGDVVAGLLIFSIQQRSAVDTAISSASSRLLPAAIWLFNPITLGVSTRGSAESLILGVVLLCVYLAIRRRPLCAGAALGLAIHLKLYPVIYSLPLFLYVSPGQPLWRPTCARCKLMLSCVAVLTALTTLFYHLYGMDFVQEAYLYHFSRGDIRHNFSVYFYSLYLQAGTGLSLWSRISTFLPQAIVQLSTALRFSSDLVTCFYTQTLLFVAFNKVFTSQYFLWFLPFSCLLIQRISVWALAAWFCAQGLWLLIAYGIEFEGMPLFVPLFVTCVLLFWSHLALTVVKPQPAR